MQQLFLEIVILMLGLLGILITMFQMLYYKTEKRLYYKIIKLKDKNGENIDIILSADNYDVEIENVIEKALSQYYLKN